jgi:hypothetical protein
MENICPEGLKYTFKALDGISQKMVPTNNGCIDECMKACDKNLECTSFKFEFNTRPD